MQSEYLFGDGVDDEEGRPYPQRKARHKRRRLGSVGVDGGEDHAISKAPQGRILQHIALHGEAGVAPGRPAVDEHDLAGGFGGGEGARDIVVHESHPSVDHRRRESMRDRYRWGQRCGLLRAATRSDDDNSSAGGEGGAGEALRPRGLWVQHPDIADAARGAKQRPL